MKIRKKKNKKNSNQKSFYFEDYINDGNLKEKKYQISVSLTRIALVFFIFLSISLIFSIKILYLGISKDKIFATKEKSNLSIKSRGDIFDRNGILIARNINIFSAGIRPKLVRDKKGILINLKLIFPDLDYNLIKKKINKSNFFYIKKNLTDTEKNKLWLLSEKSIIFEKKQIRVYPQKYLFSHLIGQIDDNNNGISGVEKYFDSSLKKNEYIKSSLELTLDANLQFIIRQELKNSEKIFNTIGSAAILMEIDTGEILSMVSLPDYDLNKRLNIEDKKYTNKVTKGVYELGSVFKTFTVAAALESKKIKADTIFENLESQIQCGGRTISEHDKLPKNLTTEDILVRSSNIGAVRIAQNVGEENYKNFLNSLGLFEKINIELEEVGTPLPFKWGKCKLATASFGHGITTTLIQLAKAYGIISGGHDIKPTILLNNNKNLTDKKNIISNETSHIINSMLRKVVSNKKGTAKFANIKGYDIGGKTGTAHKSINGFYNKKRKINTFASVFPSKKPKYVFVIMLDEPKSAPNFTYEFSNGFKLKGENRNTAGWNTVVVAGKIIEKIGPILAIKNLQALK